MKKKNIAFKVVASVLSLCFYWFMATGSDSGSSSKYNNEEPADKQIEQEPSFSNDELEEEQDTILMKDTYDNDEILEE